MEYYLVTTDHLQEGIWFKDDEDFKAGMNFAAICSLQSPVEILSFILMSNHVHFVLGCDRQSARDYIDSFKKSHAFYLFQKYRLKESLRRNKVDITRVGPEDESLERAIAYVQMNPVAANVCMTQEAYPWGTGASFFQIGAPSGEKLSSFSCRACHRMFHSKADIPADWELGENGIILPRCYVNVKEVERLFRTPKRMSYFLMASSKARKRMEMKELPSFRDQVIVSAAQDLCHSLFRSDNISDLEEKDQSEFLKQLRYRFSSDVKQLARVTGLSYERTSFLLDHA